MSAAFIVDGFLEKQAVEKLCKGKPVRRTDLNGKNVQLAAIARVVSTLIDTFSDSHYPIVVVVDREGRDISSMNMETTLRDLLEKEGQNVDNVIISCPDRMIENWICAGTVEYSGNSICCDAGRSSYDDMNGKHHLKNELSKHEISYRERPVGVEMLCKIDTALAAARSQSFQRLSTRLDRLCWWCTQTSYSES